MHIINVKLNLCLLLLSLRVPAHSLSQLPNLCSILACMLVTISHRHHQCASCMALHQLMLLNHTPVLHLHFLLMHFSILPMSLPQQLQVLPRTLAALTSGYKPDCCHTPMLCMLGGWYTGYSMLALSPPLSNDLQTAWRFPAQSPCGHSREGACRRCIHNCSHASCSGNALTFPY